MFDVNLKLENLGIKKATMTLVAIYFCSDPRGGRTRVIPHKMRDVLTALEKEPQLRGSVCLMVVPAGFEPALPA